MSGAIFSTEEIVEVNQDVIEDLKMRASNADDRKFRLCLHQNPEDLLHQSVIVFCQDAYVQPHRHPVGKFESYQIIEGGYDFYFFDDYGNTTRSMYISDQSKESTFFFRIDGSLWHMPVPRTEFVVFHEISMGPYDRDRDVEFASWAPDEQDKKAVEQYLVQFKS